MKGKTMDKQPRGRPALAANVRRAVILLPADLYEIARIAGDYNVSAGIRAALELWRDVNDVKRAAALDVEGSE